MTTSTHNHGQAGRQADRQTDRQTFILSKIRRYPTFKLEHRPVTPSGFSGMGNLKSGPKLYVTCPPIYTEAAG